MDPIQKLIDLTRKLDHLESTAEWVARETVHLDNTVCQSSTLLAVIASELREEINEIAAEIESETDPFANLSTETMQ